MFVNPAPLEVVQLGKNYVILPVTASQMVRPDRVIVFNSTPWFLSVETNADFRWLSPWTADIFAVGSNNPQVTVNAVSFGAQTFTFIEDQSVYTTWLLPTDEIVGSYPQTIPPSPLAFVGATPVGTLFQVGGQPHGLVETVNGTYPFPWSSTAPGPAFYALWSAMICVTGGGTAVITDGALTPTILLALGGVGTVCLSFPIGVLIANGTQTPNLVVSNAVAQTVVIASVTQG